LTRSVIPECGSLGNEQGTQIFSENSPLAHAVLKSEIAKSADYNLTGDRYITLEHHKPSHWPFVELSKLCLQIFNGGTPSTKVSEYWNGDIPWITSADIVDYKTAHPRKYITKRAIEESATNLIPKNNIIVVTRVGLGKLFLNDFDVCISQDSQALIINKKIVMPEFLLYVLSVKVLQFKQTSRGSTIQGVTKKQLSSLKIPLPPLEVQKKIVAEIDGYQKIIDAARQIVENYKPTIKINPAWPNVLLEKVFKLSSGRGLTQNDRVEGPYAVYGGNGITGNHNEYFLENPTLIIGRVGEYCGAVHITEPKSWVTDNAFYVTAYLIEIDQNYLACVLQQTDINQYAKVGGQPSISQSTVASIKVPLPSIDDQKQIVSEIEAEQKIVNENKKLIEIFSKKISDTISSLWS
jgi:restriction endonuclease S subunit